MGHPSKSKKIKKRPEPMDKDKLFAQRGFKKALKDSEHPDFEIESGFDHQFKEGNEIKMAKTKKDKHCRDKLAQSFAKKSNAGNYSTFYKYERF